MLRNPHHLGSVWALVALCGLWTAPTVLAQQDKEATATAEQPASGPSPAEKFKIARDKWQSVLKELRQLQADFDRAETEEAEQIRAKYAETIYRGEQLISEIRTAGMEAYAAAPQEDREVERTLVTVLMDDVDHDRYEDALAVGKVLLDNGCEVDEVFDAAGVAAFATNEFDTAETYLQRADEEGSLTEEGTEFKELIGEYKGFWSAEEKIREKEAQDELPRVRISTNKGDMVVELFENEAPETVANFVSLVSKDFYTNLSFHRVLPHFMAQGGCPTGDGTGGPGYSIYCECLKNPNYRKHFRGTLSMAHSGADTGGSQFFITFVPTANLNGKHTAFGRVIEGMDVLSKIRRIDPEATGPKPEDDKILKMEVIRKRDHEYEPNKVE